MDTPEWSASLGFKPKACAFVLRRTLRPVSESLHGKLLKNVPVLKQPAARSLPGIAASCAAVKSEKQKSPEPCGCPASSRERDERVRASRYPGPVGNLQMTKSNTHAANAWNLSAPAKMVCSIENRNSRDAQRPSHTSVRVVWCWRYCVSRYGPEKLLG